METHGQSLTNPFAGISGEIEGSVPQIAILNSLLPRGFRFEPCENMKRTDHSHQKSDLRKEVFFWLKLVFKAS